MLKTVKKACYTCIKYYLEYPCDKKCPVEEHICPYAVYDFDIMVYFCEHSGGQVPDDCDICEEDE